MSINSFYDELQSNIDFQGNDYSGKDFNNITLIDKERNFDNTYFKGCIFENVKIENAMFRHVEFDETTITNNSKFTNCYFNSSDFIYNIFEDVVFINCYFNNGEWRESSFYNVEFINCHFESTTINLCRFDKCTFDNSSSMSFDSMSKTYNVFFKSQFPQCSIDFLKYNFGLINKEKLLTYNSQYNNVLFELSLMYFSQTLINKVFIEKTISILKKISNSKARNFQAKLKYISNIIMMMSKKHFSLIQIEYLYSKLVNELSTSKNQLFFIELIKLLTSIGEDIKLYKIDSKDKYIKYTNLEKKYKLEFNFKNSYSEEQMELFIKGLALYQNLNESDIKMLEYALGSTKLILLITRTVVLTTLLQTINAFLPEVKELIRNSHEIYKEIKSFDNTLTIENKNIFQSIQQIDTSKSKKVIDATDGKILEIEGQVKLIIT